MSVTILAVVCVLVVVLVSALSPRVGIAAPLALVGAGVLLSLVPGVPRGEVQPEIILAGVLPPLLYASAVNMPVVDFRRDLKSISGLSVVVVVASAALIGLLLDRLVPGLGFAESFALGAIVSPTDAVATSIVRRTHVAPRLVTLLEGESLLNDASALVLLRSAVAAIATVGAVSPWSVGRDFLVAVVVAVAIGIVVGMMSLGMRAGVQDATLNTAVSFVVPFVAYVPTEHLGGSGLVAVVVAGLVTGYRGPVELTARDRISEAVNWRTVAFLLEGGVFLLMGLELGPLVGHFRDDGGSVGHLLAVVALAMVVLYAVRAAYVAWLLLSLRHDRQELTRSLPRLAGLREFLASDEARRYSERRRRRVEQVLQRRESDTRFFDVERLGRRDGVVLVWAGMRGAVTLAAAQTLPTATPERALLVLAAFCVAVASLAVQGGTLAWVVRRLGVEADRTVVVREELAALTETLVEVAESRCDDAAAQGLDGRALEPEVVSRAREQSRPDRGTVWAGEAGPRRDQRVADYRALRRAVLADQRDALLQVRSTGRYGSDVLVDMLRRIDAGEFAVDALD